MDSGFLKQNFAFCTHPVRGQDLCSYVCTPVTKCTLMYFVQTAGPKSGKFVYTWSRWQGTCVGQISSKSLTSLTFVFKVKESNQIQWQVHNVLEHSGVISAGAAVTERTTIPIATMSRGVRSSGRLPFAKICQGVLAYSLIFKQNVMHCILAYCIRRCVRVCVRACVRVCVYSSVWTTHYWTAR